MAALGSLQKIPIRTMKVAHGNARRTGETQTGGAGIGAPPVTVQLSLGRPTGSALASATTAQRYCLMTQTLISGFTSACKRIPTRYTPSALIGSFSSIWRFSTLKP